MTLPIPPSDSFYKFTAIGGLILVVLSLYVPWQMVSQLRIEALDLKLEVEKWEIESQHFEIAIRDAERRSQLTEKDLTALEKDSGAKKTKPPSLSHVQSLKREIQDNRSNFEQLQSKRKQLELLKAQLINAAKKLEFLTSDASNLSWISRASLAIGFIMATFGFWNWYYKFQVYQDRIVKGQSEQLATPRLKSEQEEIPG